MTAIPNQTEISNHVWHIPVGVQVPIGEVYEYLLNCSYKKSGRDRLYQTFYYHKRDYCVTMFNNTIFFFKSVASYLRLRCARTITSKATETHIIIMSSLLKLCTKFPESAYGKLSVWSSQSFKDPTKQVSKTWLVSHFSYTCKINRNLFCQFERCV